MCEGKRIITPEDVFKHVVRGWTERKIVLYERIVSRIEVCEKTGCWIWRGSDSGNGRGGGYGRMSFEGQTLAVHRAMATLFYGYIHKKQHVDHTCNNRLCVNPIHLEVVSKEVNQQRKWAKIKEVANDG